LWCNVGFAEVIKYECTSPKWPKLKYTNIQIDLNNKTAAMQASYDGNISTDTFKIESVDNEKVFMRSNKMSNYTMYFNYATDQNVHGTSDQNDTPYNCNYNRNLVKTSSSSQSGGISFTIKDKKEQCKAIGFQPASEKFADCVLRLVELDLKKQISNPTIVAQDSGNQAIVDELKRNNNMQQSQFLMNLSQQLLNPSSPASTWSTSSCTVRGGTIKTINCW